MKEDCGNALSQAEYCESHESYYHPFPGLEGKCPWCQRDRYYDELELIKETFQAAEALKKTCNNMEQMEADLYLKLNDIALYRWY